MIRRTVVLSLSALVLGLMAAPAGAATPELRGVVSGSPYGASGGYIAVPVLYSKMTARRTGLKSPVGLMVVKRTARVKVNGGPSSLPINLRVGDRFKGVAPVSSLNKRIFYPRITFEQAPSVYFRSKELSLAELTRLIQTLERNLGILAGQFGGLADYTVKSFAQVAGQVAGLQAQIDELRGLINGLGGVDLSGIQGQIDALKSQLDGLLASLADYAKLTDLAGFLREADVQALIDAALAGLNLDQFIDGTELQAALDALGLGGYIDAAELAAALAALNLGQYIDATELQAALDALNLGQYIDATELQAALDALNILTETDVQGLIDTTITGLNLGQYVDTTELNTAVNDAVNTAIGGLDTIDSTELQTALNGLNLDQYATDTTVNQLQSDLTAAEGEIATLQGRVSDLETTVNALCADPLLSAICP